MPIRVERGRAQRLSLIDWIAVLVPAKRLPIAAELDGARLWPRTSDVAAMVWVHRWPSDAGQGVAQLLLQRVVVVSKMQSELDRARLLPAASRMAVARKR